MWANVRVNYETQPPERQDRVTPPVWSSLVSWFPLSCDVGRSLIDRLYIAGGGVELPQESAEPIVN